jgi:hypothetical protein
MQGPCPGKWSYSVGREENSSVLNLLPRAGTMPTSFLLLSSLALILSCYWNLFFLQCLTCLNVSFVQKFMPNNKLICNL